MPLHGRSTPLRRYTFEDFAAIVEYARQRGVRVVPEVSARASPRSFVFRCLCVLPVLPVSSLTTSCALHPLLSALQFDTPGHAGSICTGYPDACPSPTCTMPVNPANNITYDLINSVLTEIAALSPDNCACVAGIGGGWADTASPDGVPHLPDHIPPLTPRAADMHLGGDEVDTKCWTDSAQITAWMNQHNLTADQTCVCQECGVCPSATWRPLPVRSPIAARPSPVPLRTAASQVRVPREHRGRDVAEDRQDPHPLGGCVARTRAHTPLRALP